MALGKNLILRRPQRRPSRRTHEGHPTPKLRHYRSGRRRLYPRGRKPMASFPLVSATGMLGSGYRAESLDKAIVLGARMIGCDAGSTDPGPGPLATGSCMFSFLNDTATTE